MATNREYELKFSMEADAAERLISHPLVRPGLSQRRIGHLVSTYFDTPDARLQRNRFGLRVRRADNQVVHTLKQSGGSMIDRGEWERVDEAAQPNIVWLRETPLAPLLDDADLATGLGPRFTVDVTRTTLPIEHAGTAIELAFDQGVIRSEGLSLPVSELELEVKGGAPEAAFDLARQLVHDLPLTLSLATKAERGYAVSDLTWGQPDETISPALRKRMTIAESFEAIVQSCLHTFLKNTALIGGDAVRETDQAADQEADKEAVHKTRIALRHLRAALQLYRPALRRKQLARLRPEIKWLSDRLGAARDADVFQTSFFEPLAREATVPGASALASLMDERRRRAHRRLHRALATSRARLLFVELLAFSTDGVRRSLRAEPYRPFVRSEFRRRRRRLARDAKHLAQRSSSEMHDVRKAAKMLRYDLDLIGDVPVKPKDERDRHLRNALKGLQQSLGLIHDQEAMHAQLRKLVLARPSGAPEAPREVTLAASELAGQGVERREHLRRAESAARRL